MAGHAAYSTLNFQRLKSKRTFASKVFIIHGYFFAISIGLQSASTREIIFVGKLQSTNVIRIIPLALID